MSPPLNIAKHPVHWLHICRALENLEGVLASMRSLTVLWKEVETERSQAFDGEYQPHQMLLFEVWIAR